MQFNINNDIVAVEQPANAFVKIQPLELGNYTFNNHVYASMEETTTFTTDHILGLVAGNSDRIIRYEITFTPNSNTTLVDTPTMSLSIVQTSSVEHQCNGFTATYTIDNTQHTFTSDKPTYLECIAEMISTIKDRHNINISYEQVDKYIKVYSPVDIQLTLPSELIYSNGYIACIDTTQTGDVVSTIPINNIYSGQAIVTWSTLNNRNGILVVSTTTPCDISVVQTCTIIQ